MSDFGVKISKPGKSVLNLADKDLVWSSGFKTFKNYRVLTFDSYGSKTHGLDYPPVFFAYKKIQGGGIVEAGYGYNYFGGVEVSVDDTKVYYQEPIAYPSGQVVEKVYVILCLNPLNE